MIIVLLVWAVLNIFLLYQLVHLMTKSKGKAEPVSHTDRLTQNEEYTQKLEHYAARLADITEELNTCLCMYEAESEELVKAEFEEKISSLKKQQELTRSKCRSLLKKLD